MTKSSLGRNALISTHTSGKQSSPREVKAGTQAGQKAGNRNWNRGHGKMMLTRLLPRILQPGFHSTQNHLPGPWPFHSYQELKRFTAGFATVQFGGTFSHLKFPSPKTLVCLKLMWNQPACSGKTKMLAIRCYQLI